MSFRKENHVPRIAEDRRLCHAGRGAGVTGGVHAAEQATAATPATIPAVVNGTLTYRERIALPPGSSAIVQLLDTSRADTQARLVAEQKIAIGRQVPIPFSLDYDAASLDPKNTYALAARIVLGSSCCSSATPRRRSSREEIRSRPIWS